MNRVRRRCIGVRQPWVGLSRVAMVMILMPLAMSLGCAPELGDDPVPAYFEFDPSGAEPRVPLPNIVLVNQDTGLLDYGLPNDPEACVSLASMPGAMCEFLQFMQGMDGFPSQATVSIPVSAPLDLATVTSDNLVVFAFAPRQNLDITFDDATRQLVVASQTSWDLGGTFVVAIRGYDDGVRSAAGDRVVAPVIYNLLKREESLISCNPDPPDPDELLSPEVDRSCKFFILLSEGLDPDDPADADAVAAVEAQIVDLERLRQGFLGAALWEATELIAGIPKDEVAMVFAFPIHSGPVVELDPGAGKVPEVVDESTIRLAVHGNLDPATVVAGLGPFTPARTVALLNLTKLAENDLTGGVPTFDATVIAGNLEMTTAAPLVPGDRYGIVLATVTPFSADRPAVRNLAGVPLVPPPAVVMLRSRHPVYDEVTGRSNLSVVGDNEAQALEEARLLLSELLDDELFPLDREQIGYLFAFEMPSP